MASDTFGNQTSAHGEIHTDTAFLLFNCVVLTLTFVLGLPGNLLVCLVVFRNKILRTCNNALLVNLAASDLLRCGVDTPLLLFSFLRFVGERRVSVPLCALQQFTYALCSCVQLLTLVSISVERYQAIAFPFDTERRRIRVRLWILSIWACGLVLAAVSLTLSEEAAFYMPCRQRRPEPQPGYVDPFGAYVLVPVWGLSLAIIVMHYSRIFKVVRAHRKKVFDHGIQLRSTGAAEKGWCRESVCTRATCVAPGRTVMLVREAGAPRACAPPRPPPEIVGAVCLLTPGARERGKKQMEGKVAQRFGCIIIAFMLFWVPMVVTLLMNAITETNELLLDLETSAMVLTCMQAAVDPLLYTVMTRQFRSEFSKILSSIPRCPQTLQV